MSAPRLLTVELAWIDGLEFSARLSKTSIVVDGNGSAGPSPVELLGTALAGCMCSDVVHILVKGRHAVASFCATLTAERAPAEPRRLVNVALHFDITGQVPASAVARAIELSKTKYCSVWQSMRQDIDLQVTFEIAS